MGYFGIWVLRANFGGSGHALWGNGLLLFFMVVLHISIVSSSYIIILPGMGHTCQFWGLWSRFMGQWVTVVFDGVSLHQYSQFIIYHHSIWYGSFVPILGNL